MNLFTMNLSGLEVPTVLTRDLLNRPGPIPHGRLEGLLQPRDMVLEARSPSTTTSSTDSTASCGPKDTTGPCERMVAASPNTTTIPVVLGVVLPLSFAFVILIILHRRHVKKLRQEDAEDKHKSLDFGMDGAPITEKRRRGKGAKVYPEMSAIDTSHVGRKDRGLSMDLSMNNPYLLPPELQQSRESLHSLTRSNTGDDKYRATNFIPDDGSLRSPSSLHQHDSASIYTFSSRHRADTDSTKGLLPNGHSPFNDNVSIVQKPAPVVTENRIEPAHQDDIHEFGASNSPKSKGFEHTESEKSAAELDGHSYYDEPREPPKAALRDETNKRHSVMPGAAGFNFDIPPNTYELSSGPEPTFLHSNTTHTVSEVPEIYEAPGHESQAYQYHEAVTTEAIDPHDQVANQQKPVPNDNVPEVNIISAYEDEHESDYYDEEPVDTYDLAAYKDALGYDPRLLTMGMRPLPPDDPSENPEERALRIRSFYKEYFDDTAKPGGEKARMSYFDGSENYIDDYYGSYNPSMYGYGSRGPSAMSSRGPAGRHRATVSNGSHMYGGPRAHSSASQRLPGQNRRFAPKKKLPPPMPLQVLPTPAMLKEDSMLPNALDYAPPQVFKNQRAGTPDTLRGGLRPFSPGTRAYNPLVSSFDDLSVLPSPHQLRKSGAFTSLDFAPPRFVGSSAGSDSGSIRSN